MMKILFINTVYKTTSTGNISNEIFRYCQNNNNESLFLYGRGKKYNDKNLIKFNTKFGFYLDCLFSRIFGGIGLYSKYATKKLIKIIKKFQPDIVNIHNLHGYYVNIDDLLTFLSSSEIKVVFTMHDCWLFTGHCSHFEMIGCSKYLHECKQCPQLREYPKTLFFDDSKYMFHKKKDLFSKFKNSNLYFVTPSVWLKNTFQKSSIGANKNVRVINNGINVSAFTKLNSEEKSDRQNIYFISVAAPFGEAKGFDDFLKLSLKFCDNWRLFLVGLNENQIDLIHKKYPKIIPIARTKNLDELVKLYNLSSAFINLTYQDTYPTVNLEAASIGLPIVTYNTGGSVEAALNTPYVAEKGDLNQVISYLKKIEFENFQNSKPTNINYISTKRMVEEYLSFFKTLIGEDNYD